VAAAQAVVLDTLSGATTTQQRQGNEEGFPAWNRDERLAMTGSDSVSIPLAWAT